MSEVKEWVEIVLIVISFLVVIANIVLLSMLLRTFYGSYKKIKAKFTKGLLTFVIFLLIQQFFFLMGLIALNTVRDSIQKVPAGGPVFFLNVMELIALIIFYRTTRE